MYESISTKKSSQKILDMITQLPLNLIIFYLISISLDSIGCDRLKQSDEGYKKPIIKPNPLKYYNNSGVHQYRTERTDDLKAVRGAYGFRKPRREFRDVDYSANNLVFSLPVESNEMGAKSHNSPPDVRFSPNDKYKSISNLNPPVISMTVTPNESEGIDQNDLLLESEEPEPEKMPLILQPINHSEEHNEIVNQPEDVETSNSGQELNIKRVLTESMPNINLSIEPKTFINSKTRAMISIPYLVMKTTSKMPLLPGMSLKVVKQNFQHNQM